MKKINVIVAFGGRSTEHEISVISGRSIYNALDKAKYNVIPIGITKSGRWVYGEDVKRSLEAGAAIEEFSNETTILPDPTSKNLLYLESKGDQVVVEGGEALNVVFPVLHGKMGEDGTMQGLLELANVAYVGCGVLGSALGIDKVLQKELFVYHGIPTPKFITRNIHQWRSEREKVLNEIEAFFQGSYPLFVKPANTGSSVGINKAKSRADLERFCDIAYSYDAKILVEEGIENIREIETAVLGNYDPMVSGCGEIVPANEFYDYDAKYNDERSTAKIPAEIPKETQATIREYARKAFEILELRGLSRVDFFVSKEAKPRIWLNEVNTMPGFTSISMYPKLWAAEGVSYEQLVEKLIELAIENWNEKQQLKTSR